MARSPTKEQLSNPTKQQQQTKALELMGDETLDEASRRALPKNAQVNKKTIHVLGDNALLEVSNPKAASKFGSVMYGSQITAQKEAEAKVCWVFLLVQL